MLKDGIIPSLLPTCVCLFFFANAVFAQDPFQDNGNDPFSSGSSVASSGTAKDRLIAEENRRHDVEEHESELARLKALEKDLVNRVAAQRAQIRNLQNQVAEHSAIAEMYKQKIGAIQTDADELANLLSSKNELHDKLFDQLLASEDPKFQLLAFRHCLSCLDKYVLDKHFPLKVQNPDILRRISGLTSSTNTEIQDLAAKCLFSVHKSNAIEMGIQFGDVWLPLETVKEKVQFTRIHRTLNERADFEYDEVLFVDFVEELAALYGFGFRVDPSVDPDFQISYLSRGRDLSTTLEGLLSEHDLVFAIRDREIVIMKKSDPRSLVTRTYNIKFLSRTPVEIEKVKGVIESAIPKDELKLTALNDHILVANATENNQRRISALIGSLAQPLR